MRRDHASVTARVGAGRQAGNPMTSLLIHCLGKVKSMETA